MDAGDVLRLSEGQPRLRGVTILASGGIRAQKYQENTFLPFFSIHVEDMSSVKRQRLWFALRVTSSDGKQSHYHLTYSSSLTLVPIRYLSKPLSNFLLFLHERIKSGQQTILKLKSII